MKLLYVFLLLFLPFCLKAETITITGKIKGLKVARVVYSGDTVVVRRGNYTLSIKADEPQPVLLEALDSWNKKIAEVNVFVGLGENKLTHEGKFTCVRGNFPGTAEYVKYHEKVAEMEARMDYLLPKKTDAERKEREVLRRELRQARVLYMLEHPGSVINPYLFKQCFSVLAFYNPLDVEVDRCYENLSPEGKKYPSVQWIWQHVQLERRTAPGQPLADFALPDKNGKMISTKEYRGKYVLLNFWASWCGPCRSSHPAKLKLYEQFKDRGFDILGISLDGDKKKLGGGDVDKCRNLWLEAIKEDKLPWRQVCDFKGFRSPVCESFGMPFVPFMVLIDPEGKIVGKNMKLKEMEAYLEEHLPLFNKDSVYARIPDYFYNFPLVDFIRALRQMVENNNRLISAREGNAADSLKMQTYATLHSFISRWGGMENFAKLMDVDNTSEDARLMRAYLSEVLRTMDNPSMIDNPTYQSAYRSLISNYAWGEKSKSESLQSEIDAICKEIRSREWREYLIAYFAIERTKYSPAVKEVSEIFFKEVHDKAKVKEYKDLCKVWDKIAPGKKAPALTVTDVNGNVVRLKDFRGKVVLIDFWYAHCPACRHQIRNFLPAVHERFKNEDVVFLMASVDKREKDWREAIKQDGSQGVHVLLPDQKFNEFVQKMHVTGYPTYIIIDRRGCIFNIKAPYPEDPALVDYIEEALKIK